MNAQDPTKITTVLVTGSVPQFVLGSDATQAQLTAFCSAVESAMVQAVFVLYPEAKQVEIDVFPANGGTGERLVCSALNAEELPVWNEEEKLAEEIARVFTEVSATDEWKV